MGIPRSLRDFQARWKSLLSDFSRSVFSTARRVAISLVSPLGTVASQSIDVARHAAGASEAVKVAGSNRRWDKGELSYSYVNESRGQVTPLPIVSRLRLSSPCAGL